MRNERGFTLIELLIVVAIIGLLAAIAIPKFQQMRAEDYRKRHGHYPDGYVPPENRIRVDSFQGVKMVPGYIDYYYDPKTDLCFARRSSESLTLVPCDKVKPLMESTPSNRGF